MKSQHPCLKAIQAQIGLFGADAFTTQSAATTIFAIDSKDVLLATLAANGCPLTTEAQQFLSTMPNQAWMWRAVHLVLHYRLADSFERPISKLELWYALRAYGSEVESYRESALEALFQLDERAKVTDLPAQLPATLACHFLLRGYLLLANEDGRDLLIWNPIFLRQGRIAD
ncbi:MAG: hypothetical protein K2Y32_15025 [Candidatus Obscuribacterales bacterium]|nr:hypothetical protein [Candidatus Obscuribacterales bacterium]